MTDITSKGGWQFAEETLGHDMLVAILNEVKKLPAQWADINQLAQNQYINGFKGIIQMMVRDTLKVIVGDEYPMTGARLVSYAVKDAIKVSLEIDRLCEARHEIADNAGRMVVLLIVDPERYFKRMEDVRGDADQADLFSSSGPDSSGDGEADAGPDPDFPPPAGMTFNPFTGEIMPIKPGEELKNPAHIKAWLDAIGSVVEVDAIGLWNEAERRVALEWAIAFHSDPWRLPHARPLYCPIPTKSANPRFNEIAADAEDNPGTAAAGPEEPTLEPKIEEENPPAGSDPAAGGEGDGEGGESDPEPAPRRKSPRRGHLSH